MMTRLVLIILLLFSFNLSAQYSITGGINGLKCFGGANSFGGL